MAQEVMMEKDFPCPCGRGVLRIQVLEHDVWSSGRHSEWKLLCGDCATKYREPFLVNALVLREHNEEIEKRRQALHLRRKALGEKAAIKYLPRYISFVKSLRFKTSMHEAIGGYSNIQKFRERTRLERGLQTAIEEGLRENPARALQQMNLEDPEITAEVETIAKEEADLRKFIEGIQEYPIPDIDRR